MPSIRENDHMNFALLFGFALLFSSCAKNQVQMSSRSDSLFEKKGAQIATGKRMPGFLAARKEMYVKQKNFDIKEIEKVNDTGSLYNANDERNFQVGS